jgi:5-methylcytosine-specific restriction endonuclease McrA
MSRKHTVSQAKNRMRRAAEEIVDPGPTDLEPIWTYFDARCAYCGKQLRRELREGHVDHAEPGGGNHLGNLVLACGPCNGDEKREESWRDFLHRKVGDPDTRDERAARIETWSLMHAKPRSTESQEIAALRADVENLIADFGAKCNELKALVRAVNSE